MAVTVPVRRGGLLSLVLPIPPATVSFHAAAVVHRADSPRVRPLLKEPASLLPQERRASAAVIEIIPEGWFVTYGVGVSLLRLRDPAAAGARVAVTQEGSIRNELSQGAGLVKVAEDKLYVTGLKGPLEGGWEEKVAAFVAPDPA